MVLLGKKEPKAEAKSEAVEVEIVSKKRRKMERLKLDFETKQAKPEVESENEPSDESREDQQELFEDEEENVEAEIDSEMIPSLIDTGRLSNQQRIQRIWKSVEESKGLTPGLTGRGGITQTLSQSEGKSKRRKEICRRELLAHTRHQRVILRNQYEPPIVLFRRLPSGREIRKTRSVLY